MRNNNVNNKNETGNGVAKVRLRWENSGGKPDVLHRPSSFTSEIVIRYRICVCAAAREEGV